MGTEAGTIPILVELLSSREDNQVQAQMLQEHMRKGWVGKETTTLALRPEGKIVWR